MALMIYSPQGCAALVVSWFLMQPYFTFVPNLHVNLRNINHELIQRHRVIRSLKDEKLESTSKTLSLVSVSQDSGKLGTQTEL